MNFRRANFPHLLSLRISDADAAKLEAYCRAYDTTPAKVYLFNKMGRN